MAYHHNKIEAVNAFYENERSLYFINARRAIHDMKEMHAEYKPEEIHHLKAQDGELLGNYVAYIILSHNQAGTLVKKRQLPLWLFETASGNTAVQFYDFLSPYIEYRRKDNNSDYGKPYEDLVNAIKKKYPKKEYIYRK